jgi:hypothetical protein
MAANTYVTDLRHYLDDTGDLADMPGPALNLAMFFASIVADLQRGSSEILWHCPWCGVNGVIRNWEHSLWDRRRGPA